MAWFHSAEFWSPLNASLFSPIMHILFSGLSNIQGKSNVTHVQTTFHVRIMVRFCFILLYVSANTILFMKMLNFSDND